MLYGYSTGALAFGDFRRGLSTIRESGLRAVELSALREAEVEPLLAELSRLDVRRFEFVSVHAPSQFVSRDSEATIAASLLSDVPHDWPVVLHPDATWDAAYWRPFGGRLLIENMDRRKKTGRTAHELAAVFRNLPDARLCFDIAHARQVDPSMLEAWRILRQFGDRVAEVHISELNTMSRHRRISQAAIRSFGSVAGRIPDRAAVILESILDSPAEIQLELESAQRALTPKTLAVAS